MPQLPRIRLSAASAPANKGRAAYPRGRRGPDLTAVTALPTMPRMTCRRLPVVACVLALVLAAPAGAGDSPLAKRLARALAVPHVSQARTGAVALDLQTGQTVFSEHDGLPLAPASNEKLAIAYGALVALGSDFRIETDVLGRGQQDGTVWRGSLRARRPRRPDALEREPRGARPPGSRGRDPEGDARRLCRRVVLRHAPHRRRLEVVVLRQRVPAAVGADGRPRPLPRPHVGRSGTRRRAPLRRGPAPRRGGGRGCGARHPAGRRRAARLGRVAPTLADRRLDGPRERQLHRRAPAEAARRCGRRARHERRRRGDRPRGARRRGRAALRGAARRRLRALVARPADGSRALGAAARGLEPIPTSAPTCSPRCRSPA